ncbi:MAG TPA: hypothetical protein VNI83_00180 [Vicinamibacterales bacterium]|nr:hypothetical protein [Vicinamibacterales bacterium]
MLNGGTSPAGNATRAVGPSDRTGYFVPSPIRFALCVSVTFWPPMSNVTWVS